jgi:hypothetical protein
MSLREEDARVIGEPDHRSGVAGARVVLITSTSRGARRA